MDMRTPLRGHFDPPREPVDEAEREAASLPANQCNSLSLPVATVRRACDRRREHKGDHVAVVNYEHGCAPWLVSDRWATCPECGDVVLFKSDPEVGYCYNHDAARCAVFPLRTRRLTRHEDDGTCDACGVGMWEDGVTADTHAPNCPALL